MLKPHSNPYGYKKLLAYQKAKELQAECRSLTSKFPKTKTLIDLADQMDRSARSTKQNIVEGWKRNSTKEYHDFLGFSIGAVAELEEDCDDVWRGVYPELNNKREIMGEKGNKGLERDKMGGRGDKGDEMGGRGFNGSERGDKWAERGEKGFKGNEWGRMGNKGFEGDIEELKFYPLDKSLPEIVQLKLRCKKLFNISHPDKTLKFQVKNKLEVETYRDKLRLKRSFATEISKF